MPRTLLQVREVEQEAAPPSLAVVVSRSLPLDAETVAMIFDGDLVPGVSSPEFCRQDGLTSAIALLAGWPEYKAEPLAEAALRWLRNGQKPLYISRDGKIAVRRVK
jgi:hypothetical protein